MTMKQTQTKLFDFSDAGLDFSAGSKNLFPDRFKKMLSLGYNAQIVTSVAVAGNQATFTYGGTHGYVADRILKVDSGALSSINGGEFWIDSVTTNTVTLTIDNAPISVAGGFVTKIAPLGWQLVYEQSTIHVYKFKQLDETDIYLRLVFQQTPFYRNSVAACVGKTFDVNTGVITDPNALAETKSLMSVAEAVGFRWEFSYSAISTDSNYTYAQGLNIYGKGSVVGSLYHLAIAHSLSATFPRIVGVFPIVCHNYPNLQYPVLIGEQGASAGGSANTQQALAARAYIGNMRVNFDYMDSSQQAIFQGNNALSSFLPSNIDGFNTTTVYQPFIFHQATQQHLGYIAGGLYVCKYASTNTAPTGSQNSPSVTADVDLNSKIIMHYMTTGSSHTFLAFPIEDIKYA